VTRPVVAIRTCEHRSTLLPTRAQSWVSTSVPGEQTQTIIRRPAEARGVRNICLAAVVHGCRAFHDGAAVLFPRVGGCGKHFRGAEFAGGSHGRDAEGLERAGHARPDEIVAPCAEADDAAIDAPGGGQLSVVGVFVKGVGAACGCVREVFLCLGGTNP
jgi:hypothetical protein